MPGVNLYKGHGNNSTFRSVTAKVNYHAFSRLEQLRTIRGDEGSNFMKVGILGRTHCCEFGHPEMVNYLMKYCAFCESGCRYLKKTSSELELRLLLDSKKIIEAMVKVLYSLLHLLNSWLA